ncbi:MAG TPA: PAS domain S-box protein [Thermoanaerobaculia bacterium]|nr:PAS domain S-box protein [Thermoanaerobaculia bacterium]
MSWITVLWSIASAVCAALAIIHLLIWFEKRSETVNLLFALASFGAAGNAVAEMGMLKAATVGSYAFALRASFAAIALLVVSMVWYVREYFGNGRRSLAVAVTASWSLVLIADIVSPYSPVFQGISGLRVAQTPWGETFSIALGATGPLVRVVDLADLVLFVFFVDIIVTLFRRGDHPRAIFVGGVIAVLLAAAVVQERLVDTGRLQMPYVVTFVYLGVVMVAGYPLTAEMFRARELAIRLQASEAGLLESRIHAVTAAKAMEQAETRFRLVVEAAPNAMIMVDPSGLITLVNRQTEAVFGYRREELIGLPIETLIPERFRSHNPGDRGRYFASPSARKMGAGHDLFGRRKDGSEVPVEVGLNPIHSSEGVFALASVIDITERKQAELALEQQRNELAHLSRVTMLGELSGSLAHELNQPLSAILSNAQAAQRFLASDASDLDEVRDILKDIVEQDKRAGEVIRRLRLLLTKGEVHRQPLDLSEVLLEVLKLVRGDLVNQGVAVASDLAPDLPPVSGDRVQIQQVMLNLVMNGCDAMSATERARRTLLVRTARENGGGVLVSVGDRGCGIPQEKLARVFDPFFTTKRQGMGLGLAVCRSIIEAHDGRLWVESEPGVGATFHFTIPKAGAGS